MHRSIRYDATDPNRIRARSNCAIWCPKSNKSILREFCHCSWEENRPKDHYTVEGDRLLEGIDTPVKISSLSCFPVFATVRSVLCPPLFVADITPKVITIISWLRRAALVRAFDADTWKRGSELLLFVVSTTTSARDWAIKGNFMVLSRERTDSWKTGAEIVSTKWPFYVSENSAKLSAASTWLGGMRINSYMTDRTYCMLRFQQNAKYSPASSDYRHCPSRCTSNNSDVIWFDVIALRMRRGDRRITSHFYVFWILYIYCTRR